MKKVMAIIRDLVICMVITVFMTAVFFGAVLQESYKLQPLTAQEVLNG